ncbi:RICIN domain-containing protein [Streptomyces sp. NPDC052396]|uniref:RICIN domain-containing protein n=1 Tax=Streptomyces sp. NPDC052396 TaxID=3365689 RepID=UPI0037D64003
MKKIGRMFMVAATAMTSVTILSSPAHASNGNYVLRSIRTNLCATYQTYGGAMVVDMETCNGSTSQIWHWNSPDNNAYGEFNAYTAPSTCLGINPNSTPQDPSVGAWVCGTIPTDQSSVWMQRDSAGGGTELWNQNAMNQGRDRWPKQMLAFWSAEDTFLTLAPADTRGGPTSWDLMETT